MNEQDYEENYAYNYEIVSTMTAKEYDETYGGK